MRSAPCLRGVMCSGNNGQGFAQVFCGRKCQIQQQIEAGMLVRATHVGRCGQSSYSWSTATAKSFGTSKDRARCSSRARESLGGSVRA
jgi:hypothetical protein